MIPPFKRTPAASSSSGYLAEEGLHPRVVSGGSDLARAHGESTPCNKSSRRIGIFSFALPREHGLVGYRMGWEMGVRASSLGSRIISDRPKSVAPGALHVTVRQDHHSHAYTMRHRCLSGGHRFFFFGVPRRR